MTQSWLRRRDLQRAQTLLKSLRAGTPRPLASIGAGMVETFSVCHLSWWTYAAVGIVSAITAVYLRAPLIMLAAILPPLAKQVIDGLQKKRQAYNFEKDYTALLLSLASAVRTGLDPLAALAGSERLFAKDSELNRQLRLLNLNIQSGKDEEEAILNFARDIDHPDIGLFRTAFLLARKEGSSLAGCLQRLAQVTRQRQSFRRKTRAAVALQRLSALGIGACTVFISALQYAGNKEALDAALLNPTGQRLLCFGGALVVSGIVWMLALTRTRI